MIEWIRGVFEASEIVRISVWLRWQPVSFSSDANVNSWAPVDEQLARRGRESMPGQVAHRQAPCERTWKRASW